MPPPEFETVAELVALLKTWSTNIPTRIGEVFSSFEVGDRTADFGERFGSWYLRLMWSDGELTRSAEIALTNTEATSDGTSDNAVISVIATAATELRFVVEHVYDKRRSVRRIGLEALEGWVVAALERAHGYTVSSLREAYVTPIGPHST